METTLATGLNDPIHMARLDFSENFWQASFAPANFMPVGYGWSLSPQF